MVTCSQRKTQNLHKKINLLPAKNTMPTKNLYSTLQNNPFVLAGPCALESYELALEVAYSVAEAADKAGLFAVFKSSWDKANRTSKDSFRGPGLETGCEWLSRIKEKVGLPIVTDVHTEEQTKYVAPFVDIVQIPAFLCRQTDLLTAAAQTNCVVNVKKGQFLAPWDMAAVRDKVFEAGNKHLLLTERGSSFGYNNLVVDFRSFAVMRELGCPVVFDATHAVQLPGGLGKASGGERKYVASLARAAVAFGIDGLFVECHPDPDKALCDGPNSLNTKDLPAIFSDLARLWKNEYSYK